MNESRTCKTCGVTKSIEEFSLETIYSGKVRKPIKNRRTVCTRCRYDAKNAKKSTPEGRRNRRLRDIKWRHGLSADEYLEMVEKQENLCAICQSPPGSKALAIDHDHVTNKTRELLCTSCNFALGWFKDDIEVMQKAILYIEKHQNSNKPIREVIVDWGNRTRPFSVVRNSEAS